MDQAIAELLQQACVEVYCLSVSVYEAKRRAFDSKHIHNIEVSPDCNPCAVFLVLFNFEATAEEPEHLGTLAHQLRDGSYLHVLATVERVVRAVHEN